MPPLRFRNLRYGTGRLVGHFAQAYRQLEVISLAPLLPFFMPTVAPIPFFFSRYRFEILIGFLHFIGQCASFPWRFRWSSVCSQMSLRQRNGEWASLLFSLIITCPLGEEADSVLNTTAYFRFGLNFHPILSWDFCKPNSIFLASLHKERSANSRFSRRTHK